MFFFFFFVHALFQILFYWILLLFCQDNNLERAADWVFSHAAELDAPMETDEGTSGGATQYRDGSGSKFCSCIDLYCPWSTILWYISKQYANLETMKKK